MKLERDQLEKNIMNVLLDIKTKRNKIIELKNKVSERGISPGNIQKILNQKISISEVGLPLLCLITMYVYEVTGNESINPEKFFTDKEIKQTKNTDFSKEIESDKYPIVFDNVIILDNEDYMTKIDVERLVNLYENVLEYNFETQRESAMIKRENNIIHVPKINMKSVNQIKDCVLNNNLISSVLTFNLLSDGNDALHFDTRKQQLIIESGELDILDGFHRISGIVKAFYENPEIDQEMYVTIKNYNVRKAQSYIAQINTINKVDKAHLQQLKVERYSDIIVKEMQRDSDLKGKIVQRSRVTELNQGIVSTAVLADTIEEVYNIKTKKEAMDIADYLIKFFDYLVGLYPDWFMDIEKAISLRQNSLFNHNIVFAGYIVVAKRFQEYNVPLHELENFIKDIDFCKEKSEWERAGVLRDGVVTSNARKNVKKYFEEIIIEWLKEKNYISKENKK